MGGHNKKFRISVDKAFFWRSRRARELIGKMVKLSLVASSAIIFTALALRCKSEKSDIKLFKYKIFRNRKLVDDIKLGLKKLSKFRMQIAIKVISTTF